MLRENFVSLFKHPELDSIINHNFFNVIIRHLLLSVLPFSDCQVAFLNHVIEADFGRDWKTSFPNHLIRGLDIPSFTEVTSDIRLLKMHFYFKKHTTIKFDKTTLCPCKSNNCLLLENNWFFCMLNKTVVLLNKNDRISIFIPNKFTLTIDQCICKSKNCKRNNIQSGTGISWRCSTNDKIFDMIIIIG